MKISNRTRDLPACSAVPQPTAPPPPYNGVGWRWSIVIPVFPGNFRDGIARAERDGTRAETRFRLSPKQTSPFKSVGASGQSTAGSRGVRISLSNVGYTTFGGGVRVLATHSIRQFPLHSPSRASPCATTFRTSSTSE